MKIQLIFFLPALLVVAFGANKNCPARDEEEARRQDPGRECKKACSDDSDCSGPRKSCHCDDLCGFICFNKEALCPDLTDTLGNGTIKMPLGRKYKSRAVHSCREGFYLDGAVYRICRSDKKWSSSPPTCRRGCDPPGRVGNGFVGSTDNGFQAGVTVTYKCNTGYIGTGNFNITCKDDYTWTTPSFICSKLKCKKPLEVDNAKLIGEDFSFGRQIKYVCEKGHIISGTESFRCFANAKWYPSQPASLPTCDPVSCPAPSELKNGKVNEDHAPRRVYAERISYSCNKGFKLNGLNTGRCNENGTWGTVPKCEVDPDCNFETYATPTCGYEVVRGNWDRTYDAASSDGLPGYDVKGSGVLRSPSFPIKNESFCVKFKHKSQITGDKFILSKRTPGKSNGEVIWKAKQDDGNWVDGEAILANHDPSSDEIYWEFKADSTVRIDDVRLVKDPNCKSGIPPSVRPKIVKITEKPTEPGSLTTSVHPTVQVIVQVTNKPTVPEMMSSEGTDLETTKGPPIVLPKDHDDKIFLYIFLPLGILILVLFAFGGRRSYVKHKRRKKIIILEMNECPNVNLNLVDPRCEGPGNNDCTECDDGPHTDVVAIQSGDGDDTHTDVLVAVDDRPHTDVIAIQSGDGDDTHTDVLVAVDDRPHTDVVLVQSMNGYDPQKEVLVEGDDRPQAELVVSPSGDGPYKEEAMCGFESVVNK